MSSLSIASIPDLLAGAEEAPAIGAPGREPLSRGALRSVVQGVAVALAAEGICPGDRVAIVTDNGPEAATAFLGVAALCEAAPLNPVLREDDYRFYLEDLKARALLVADDETGPAVAAAQRLGVKVLRFRADRSRGAGSIVLPAGSAEGRSLTPQPGQTALVLHTSGTTARPKLVPLTHRNLTVSSRNIAATLALGPDDVCLNVMPLFHIHGLAAALLASLAAGACVVCTPGFNALKFFAWMDETRPTWFTAVPTMHQAILARADRNVETVAANRLRFVRSSSAPLPPTVMMELENVFGCPALEAYGMTEAAHQMTSNKLPPDRRKAGSVGTPAGPEVAVMSADGRVVPAGETGEVVIRGDNVMSGYFDNATANDVAFTEGWFRTGDQGHIDADGFLTLTGRLKEIINRGGEKISPVEIDNALLQHPAIGQAVAFAVPHTSLGEEIGAAIVTRPEVPQPTETELRTFLTDQLASFKIPRRFVFLDEIPKGPTGKLMRIGLAAKLGLA